MSEFSNATIVKKANVYFDGAVTSRSITLADGTTKTLGFMQVGEYEFNTDKPELMEIQGGTCSVQLDGEEEWKDYSEGESFNVPGSSKFKIKANTPTDYICSFID